MSSRFPRGRKLYAKIKDVDGVWQQVPTGFSVGQEREADAWIAEQERDVARVVAAKGGARGALTVTLYARTWLDRRTTATVDDDRTRIERHALPMLGHLLMTEVRPRHLRDLIEHLKTTDLAPATIRQVSGVLHSLFKSAVVDEIIASNPVVYERGVLPAKADKDPNWRHLAIYSRDEVVALVSSDKLPPDRRVLYALKSIAMLRHGEAAALTWAQREDVEPLGALNLGKTKSGVPRRVPIHKTLAGILDAWWSTGWASLYGRAPTIEDLIVPTRRNTVHAPAESQKQLVADLEVLGLRIRASSRNRRGHDLRRAVITLCRSDGAADAWLRWITHGPRKNEMLDVYSTPPWAVLCEQIEKLKLPRLRGAVWCSTPRTGPRPGFDVVYKRPQRDSNEVSVSAPAIRRKSERVVAAGRVASASAEVEVTAPRLGARCDAGLALIAAAGRR